MGGGLRVPRQAVWRIRITAPTSAIRGPRSRKRERGTRFGSLLRLQHLNSWANTTLAWPDMGLVSLVLAPNVKQRFADCCDRLHPSRQRLAESRMKQWVHQWSIFSRYGLDAVMFHCWWSTSWITSANVTVVRRNLSTPTRCRCLSMLVGPAMFVN